ncbi:hypothetical protein SAMN02745111_02432 [Eubacterium uniforme]|uniref:Uncharacterized protein n=1 Tax=Eubacterium uniforme TaxID=39495 RepID=A0A1T4W6N1_9FIRM|nr:hypothetical protein [Eubacterium uniforme]SKA72932.1 hypothetical protein SAMN02745111_02432 [Eubacterium uniforme]
MKIPFVSVEQDSEDIDMSKEELIEIILPLKDELLELSKKIDGLIEEQNVIKEQISEMINRKEGDIDEQLRELFADGEGNKESKGITGTEPEITATIGNNTTGESDTEERERSSSGANDKTDEEVTGTEFELPSGSFIADFEISDDMFSDESEFGAEIDSEGNTEN